MTKSKLAIASFVLPFVHIMLPFLFILFMIIFRNPTGSTNINTGGFILISTIAFVGTWWISGLALILGIVALVKIKRHNLEGKGFAITGIIMGSAFLLLPIIVIIVYLAVRVS